MANRVCIRFQKPEMEELLLFYFFTMPLWKDLIFDHLPMGRWMGVSILLALLVLVFCRQVNYWGTYLDVIIFYGAVFLLFFLKFWYDEYSRVWLTRTYGVMNVIQWGWIFAYAVFRVQNSVDSILDTLKRTGVVLALFYAWQAREVIMTGYWTYHQFGVTRQTTSNMLWSYNVLTAIVFLSIFIFKDKKKIYIIPIIIGMIGILLYGSRGTFIAIVVGILLMTLFYNDRKMRLRNYVGIILLALSCMFLLSDIGLNMVVSILDRFGLQSRLVDSILTFSSFKETSNGRYLIWATSINLIKHGPFYGYGVYGERNAIYNLGMSWGYSHNIFLEILVSFGWLFGSIIILLLIFGFFRFFKRTDNKMERALFICFLTISFELVLSNSMWLHCGLWSLMALYVNHFKHQYVEED